MSQKIRLLRASCRRIAQDVAEAHQIPFDELLSCRRAPARIRQEAYWRCATETYASYVQIGIVFDRHWTTVIHGVRAHMRRVAHV